MRFLIVSLGYHPDVIGGAWRVAAAQARGLAARGHEVEVVTAHPGGDLPAVERRDGVTLHRYPHREGNFLRNWRSSNRAAAGLIRQSLENSGRDCLLIQHHAYLEPAVAHAPARVLHVFHGPWSEEYRSQQNARPRGMARRLLDRAVIPALHRVESRALRRADRILVLSRHFAEGLGRWHGGRLPPIEVAPGGVDLDRFLPLPDRAAIRLEHGLSPEDVLFVAMRRLDPRMGLDVLVDAFARVVPAFPRAHLWLTGRGPAEPGLRARIAQHGLAASVRLLGVLPENALPRLLNAADAAVMPSLELEGFGLATAEALACGTPVLGSRSGATPEVLEPLDRNLLFEPGSVRALAERLTAALADPAGMPPRERCAAYARSHFSWNSQVSACERAAARNPMEEVAP